jgi:hypothetical protein
MEHIAELHGPEAMKVRAVRIAVNLGKGVMLAMHGNPFARAEAGGNPETQSEEKRNDGMQLERFMRGAAMEKNSGAENRYLRDEERREQTPE